MEHIFFCKYCYNPILFSLDNSITKVMNQEKTFSSTIEYLKKNEICDICYEKLSENYQSYSLKLDEEIEEIDKKIDLFKKDISNCGVFEKLLNIDINELQSRENKSKITLENLENEYFQLNNELKDLLKEYNLIISEENKVIKNLYNLEENLINKSKTLNQLKNQIQLKQHEQKNLVKDNIYDLLFNIEIYEKYGKINGINMTIKDKKINFKDLYCGWGYILNLTNFLINKSNYFNNNSENNDDLKIFYFGDYSYIEDSKNKKNYNLSTNQDLNKKTKTICLNEFMEAYLMLLINLSHKINKLNNKNYTNTKKYTITNKKINNYYIEIDFNNKNFNEENWNLCIKNLLIILKNYIKIILEEENKKLKFIL
jgi:hypothetical protein